MNVIVHEATSLFPMLDDRELDQLAGDISRRGQIEPIVTFGEKILDGRNRLEACRRANVEPRFRELGTCESPAAYVISANLLRRHLTPVQRSAYAADPAVLAPFRDEAKQRQRAHGGTAPGRPVDTSPRSMGKRSHEGEAARLAAAAFKAGITATEQMASVAKRAPEVLAAAKAGLIGTVADAVRISRLDPEARAEVLLAITSGTEPRQAVAEYLRAERIERVAQISLGNSPITGDLGRFPVIYADPPWRYEHVKTGSRAIENQYPTMDLEAICALPVGDTDDAILFLWATSPKLAEAMRVIDGWGFTYRTCMAWVKDQIGMGYYARQRHELLLIAARGALLVPLPANRPDSVIEQPLGGHSSKPAIFAELIERMYPEHKRIELFCRAPRPGWAAWGNEAEPTDVAS